MSKNFGIDVTAFGVDFAAVMARKNAIVEKLKNGVRALLKMRKVDIIKAEGVLKSGNRVVAGGEEIEAKYILIATGSHAAEFEAYPHDGKLVYSADDVVNINRLPKAITVLGAGAVGCEIAQIFTEFGSEVTLVELRKSILPGFDREISGKLHASLVKKNVKIMTDCTVESIKKDSGKVKAALSSGESLISDAFLVSIGRRLNTGGIGLEKADVNYSERGIDVDSLLRTSRDNIYAAGDCTGGEMYAHVAMYEAILACDNMAGKKRRKSYKAVPRCVFSSLEVASVGLNEDLAKARGLDVRVSRFPYAALGKAHAIGQTEGMVKIVGEVKKGTIIGADIVGPYASNVIAELTLAVNLGVKIEDIAHTIHAHPTIPEAVSEAAYAFLGYPIHAENVKVEKKGARNAGSKQA
jgi:dihydrolipoamide dehydrogenase